MATNTTPSIEEPQGQKTPPNAAAPENLQSTPSHAKGSAAAAVSDTYTSLKVDEAVPWVTSDLQRHQQCEFLVMLKILLRRVANSNAPQSDDDLLEQCLEEVVGISNARGNGTIREELVEFARDYEPTGDGKSRKRREEDYYAPFVLTFNRAFENLKKCRFPALRAVNKELDILFHRNDPSELTGLHSHDRGLKSKRKPDVILVAQGPAYRASSRGNQSRSSSGRHDVRFVNALKKPTNAFAWADVFSCVEFKPSHTLSIPDEYSTAFSSRSSELKHQGVDRIVYLTAGDAVASSSGSAQHLHPDAARTSGEPTPGRSASSEDQQQTPAVSKRKSDDKMDSGASKKSKQSTGGATQAAPIIQCGLYAAEMLSRGPYATHAINFLVYTDRAWLWWYDRQGAIQCNGINFVQDLPYFLVLLAVFQRFDLRDWGIEPELMNKAMKHHIAVDGDAPQVRHDGDPFVFEFDDGGKVVVERQTELYHRYSLLGRGTNVFEATAVDKRYQPRAELAVKISWPEKERTSEITILQEIVEKGKGDKYIEGHVPELLGGRTLEYCTQKIRDELGALNNSQFKIAGPRVLRVILMPKLKPVTSLSLKEFLPIWAQCYRCHFRLWMLGIEHSDISLSNIMYDPNNDGCGVLNDFDLARIHAEGDSIATGKERTGTIPFMALDLLTDEYIAGKVTRLYRHDLESFIWALAYKLLVDSPHASVVRAWETGDHTVCAEKKTYFRSRYRALGIAKHLEDGSIAADTAIRWLFKYFTEIDHIKDMIDDKEELTAKDTATHARWYDTGLESASQLLRLFENGFASDLKLLDMQPLIVD